MDKIKCQVAVARRRMITQQFLAIGTWALFATLLVAVAGLAVPKLWFLPLDRLAWLWWWVGGAVGAGLLVAAVWTYAVRRNALEAAIEIDRRFGLKERISSTLALGPDELASPIGQALVQDALRRVDLIEVREQFPVVLRWRSLLPVLPAVAIFVLATFVPDATRKQPVVAAVTPPTDAARVQKAAQELQKRLANTEKKAEEKGLKDTDLLFKELRQGLEDLANKDNTDRKDALVKLNDLAKSIEKRRDQLGGAEKMREQLANLKNLQQGPADKIANAVKEGDFGKAAEELKKLQEELKNNQLTDEQKEQLGKQLEQLQQKLQNLADAHEQAKAELQQEMERRRKAGDLEGAGKLQQKLDQLNRLNNQVDRLREMASKLSQCKQCLQKGDCQGAAAELTQLGEQLEALKDELEQLETLEQALDQIAQAKEAMGCQQCDGEGCAACMGGGKGKNDGPPGMGLGEGRGKGDRPEQQTDTSFYQSQVRGKVKPGEAVVSGTAGGPNRAGKSAEAVRDVIKSNLSKEPDPLVDARLPRKERQHAMEYFNRFNRGK